VTGDPVAWVLVEPGWEVVGSDGRPVGKVKEVLGAEDADIFDGLVITRGLLGKERYVPAERVRSIFEGRVEVDLDEAAVEALAAPEDAAPG
jgi:ribosomal 30S subunit maturation factor RimM